MSLVQDITHDLTQAMKAREEPRLSTLRMLKAELQKLQADKGKSYEITDSDVQTIIKRLIKQRKDAAEQYSSGGAADRAQAELAEVKNHRGSSRNQRHKPQRYGKTHESSNVESKRPSRRVKSEGIGEYVPEQVRGVDESRSILRSGRSILKGSYEKNCLLD